MSFRDNSGQTPEVGDYVAYNYSGQIATGWITKISPRHHFRIWQNDPKPGHQSLVRGGPRCVLVLAKADPLNPVVSSSDNT